MSLAPDWKIFSRQKSLFRLNLFPGQTNDWAIPLRFLLCSHKFARCESHQLSFVQFIFTGQMSTVSTVSTVSVCVCVCVAPHTLLNCRINRCNPAARKSDGAIIWPGRRAPSAIAPYVLWSTSGLSFWSLVNIPGSLSISLFPSVDTYIQYRSSLHWREKYISYIFLIYQYKIGALGAYMEPKFFLDAQFRMRPLSNSKVNKIAHVI